MNFECLGVSSNFKQSQASYPFPDPRFQGFTLSYANHLLTPASYLNRHKSDIFSSRYQRESYINLCQNVALFLYKKKKDKKTYLIRIRPPQFVPLTLKPLSSCDWECKRSDVINLFHPNYERQSGRERERRRKKSLITRKCWRGSGAPVCQLRSSWHTHTHIHTYTHILTPARTRTYTHTRTHTHTHTPEGVRPWGS